MVLLWIISPPSPMSDSGGVGRALTEQLEMSKLLEGVGRAGEELRLQQQLSSSGCPFPHPSLSQPSSLHATHITQNATHTHTCCPTLITSPAATAGWNVSLADAISPPEADARDILDMS